MSKAKEGEGKFPKNSKPLVAVIGIVCILAIAFAVYWFAIKDSSKEEEPTTENTGAIGYESDIVLEDAKDLNDKIKDMIKQVEEGQMSLELKTQANSSNGKDFVCYLANSKKNTYETYLVITLDDTNEEIYRSGLIPIGGRIEKFTSKKELETGRHMATLTYYQVESDQKTVHANVAVEFTLEVK